MKRTKSGTYKPVIGKDYTVFARWFFVLTALLALALPILFAQDSDAATNHCETIFEPQARLSHLNDTDLRRIKRWNFSLSQKPLTYEEWHTDISAYVKNENMRLALENLNREEIERAVQAFRNVTSSRGLSITDVFRPWTKNIALTSLRLSERNQVEDKIRESTLDFLTRLPQMKKSEVSSALDQWYADANLARTSGLRARINSNMVSLEPKNRAEDFSKYNSVIDETVEVFFSPKGIYGHSTLRIGQKYFSLDDVKDARIMDYSPRFGTTGKVSFLFKVSKEKIAQAMPLIEKLYTSAREFNLPPYELFPGPLEIKQKDVLKARSASPTLGNRAEISATLQRQGAQLMLSNSLLSTRVLEQNGRLYIDSFSCSTIVSHVLRKHFGIEIGDALPIALTQSLMLGNPEGAKPSAVVYYD